MARKVYRCLTGDCVSMARCFETRLLLDFHLLLVHGVAISYLSGKHKRL